MPSTGACPGAALPAATHVSYNDIDALEAAVDGETAAIILEPIQGEGGIWPATAEYLQAARRIADANGALLIADEIQSGFRTGVPFAMSAAGVTPHIMRPPRRWQRLPHRSDDDDGPDCRGKSSGAHGTTFGANPLAARAIVTTLRALRDRDLYNCGRPQARP
ncbi:MAG: aminotransferase class III-fold pyridoxal phosphate-dependent enzyme [Thermomicrobiales bacterium]